MKNKYFVKFCGITNITDAVNAENAGCNAIGFVFVKQSTRYIDSQMCQKIITKLAPTTLTVALFANNTADEIQQVLQHCPIHVLQFHGNETAEFCNKWHKPYWKAIPMADNIDPILYAQGYPTAAAYLIDNFGMQKSAGSGHKFDWDKLPQDTDNKWILAGGLTPENISQARDVSSIRCFDVSSGIEKYAGIKSQQKMNKFIEELND